MPLINNTIRISLRCIVCISHRNKTITRDSPLCITFSARPPRTSRHYTPPQYTTSPPINKTRQKTNHPAMSCYCGAHQLPVRKVRTSSTDGTPRAPSSQTRPASEATRAASPSACSCLGSFLPRTTPHCAAPGAKEDMTAFTSELT